MFYESAALRRFAGVDLGVAPAPDETTICRFRHLLEKHRLGEEMLETVNHHLASRGIQIATGMIVDATIIHAPSSTKNASGERDPESIRPARGPVVLRPEGAHRRGQQAGRGAFGMHLSGQCGGLSHAARLTARRGAKSMGRRRLSGDREDHNRLCANFVLVNLYLHRKHLATLGE
jgi:IS5 family transposase